VKNLNNQEIVLNYIRALDIRRDAHTLGAIFHGRHPIGNAIVPGGVSSLVTTQDVSDAKLIINKIRNFINTAYVVDVVTAATRSNFGFNNYWHVGTNPQRLLSYGEYPNENANAPFKGVGDNDMLLSRGVVTGTSHASLDLSLITERVTYSYYSSPDNLHPSAGVTTPDLTRMHNGANNNGHYSWLKAPRYNDLPHEVGPLARVLASFTNTNPVLVDAGNGADVATVALPVGTLRTVTGPYSITTMVSAALGDLTAVAGQTIAAGNLYSPLGRHAARMLECKFIADAMGGGDSYELGDASWLDALSFTTATDFSPASAGESGTPNSVAYGYVYQTLPKQTVSGTGLAEAPRGALGHWITIEDKKISRYQCVVPSTWNCGPKDGTNIGVAESAVVGVPVCAGDPLSHEVWLNDAIVNCARMLHPYDFCIACAVHLVTPEGKEIAKFEMDPDGKIKKFPVDSE
jgi:hydrogenase large subunit